MDPRIARLKIDTSRPGFYDAPEFVAAERRDPTLLEGYAELVLKQKHSQEYLGYAREQIRAASAFLLDELRKDGRQGACHDMTSVLGLFLARLGVWNVGVIGNVLITFDPQTGLPPTRMDTRGNEPGHAWLIAPPFHVVDLTIEHQDYRQGEEQYLVAPILADAATEDRVAVEDLYGEEWHEDFVADNGRPASLIDVREGDPVLMARVRALGVRRVDLPLASIKYVPTVVRTPDPSLERMSNRILSGQKPIDLWNEFRRRGL